MTGLRHERGQALLLLVGALAAVLVGAFVLGAVARGVGRQGRDQRAADLAALAGARAMGEVVVLVGRVRYRGMASGAESESAVGWMLRSRRGKVIRLRMFRDSEEALEAVGCGSRDVYRSRSGQGPPKLCSRDGGRRTSTEPTLGCWSKTCRG
jgi:hypothetical protein